MPRKTLWLILALILVALALVACGEEIELTATPEPATPTAEPTKEPTGPCAPTMEGPLTRVDPRGATVAWWHYYQGDREEEILSLVEQFNESNECGITVEAQSQGDRDDLSDKMNAGVAGGELPGLVVGDQSDQAFYALDGGLTDLDVYIDDPYWGLSEDDVADFNASALEQGVHSVFDSQRLGFPLNRSMEILVYNQTWLEELEFDGPPPTPDEFKEMACAAAEANGDGTGGYILRDDASAVAAWTLAFGGNILSEEGIGYVYNREATLRAMVLLKEMVDEGCAYSIEGYPNPEFAARRAIFAQGSSSNLPYYDDDLVAAAKEEGRKVDEWGVTAIPHTTADPVQNIYGVDLMIPVTTPEIELAAWIFLKWFTSAEIQAEWAQINNSIPTRASAAEFLDDYEDENPQWAVALELLPYSSYEPQLISYRAVSQLTSVAYDEIMQGADLRETLAALTGEANRLQAELMAGIGLVDMRVTPVSVEEPCAPAEEGPLAGVDPRGGEVIWWRQRNGSLEEGLSLLVEQFNAVNECGITVLVESQGAHDDLYDMMTLAIADDELPGLVIGDQIDQAFYALGGGLVDMDAYVDDVYWGLTPEELADFNASFLEQGVHPGFDKMRLGFPLSRSMEVLYYNQTWLEELEFDGPPPTPDEFKEMACAAAEANDDGTGGYILRDDASAVAAWTFAFGGSVLDEDGTGYVYNSKATDQAMTLLQEMVDEGCAYSAEGNPSAEFAARRAIFTQGSNSEIPTYISDIEGTVEEDEGEPDLWGVTAIPHTTDDPVQNVYGADVMIPATTPETQLAAWIFLKWFTSPEIQAEWVRISNSYPTRASTADLADYVSENPQWGTTLDLLPFGSYEPRLVSYHSVRDAVQAAFNEIMQGADIRDTLDVLTDEANRLQEELMEEIVEETGD